MQNEAYTAASERIEQQALDDLFQTAPDDTRQALGLARYDTSSGTCYLAAKEPNILLNRVIGIGIQQPATAADIGMILDCYSAAGVADYFLHIQPWVRPAQIWNWLFEAGLARSRGWTQFVRNAASPAGCSTALRVEQIGPGYADEFARIAADGFDLSVAARPAIAALVGLPGWYHFMTFSGDQPAGVAALRVADDVAWFDWAATDVAFRGQGSQTALLNRRIEKALELGCHTLCTETGEAVPGDPQHSFRNLVKAGFRPTHTRDNFSPTAAYDENGRIPSAAS